MCIGPGNGVGGFTDGWNWGTPDPETFVAPPHSSSGATPGWVGTSSNSTAAFGYTGAVSLNWGFHLTSASDSGQISNADSLARYTVSADIDTAKGAWFDNTNPGQGWLHDLDIGLFKSDVNTRVKLSIQGVNQTNSNFGFTIFEGVTSNNSGYVHHGAWNLNKNGTDTAAILGLATNPVVATTDTSGTTPINLNEIYFDAEAGQIYTVVLGGWRDGTWFATTDGYKLDVAAVPVPAAVWMFASGLGVLGFTRKKATLKASN